MVCVMRWTRRCEDVINQHLPKDFQTPAAGAAGVFLC
jgi:hypothetical protein